MMGRSRIRDFSRGALQVPEELSVFPRFWETRAVAKSAVDGVHGVGNGKVEAVEVADVHKKLQGKVRALEFIWRLINPEHRLLEKIRYKARNQHRNTQHLAHLKQVLLLLNRTIETHGMLPGGAIHNRVMRPAPIGQKYQSFRAASFSPELCVLGRVGIRGACDALLSGSGVLTTSFISFRGLLAKTYFIPYALTGMAAVSRLHALYVGRDGSSKLLKALKEVDEALCAVGVLEGYELRAVCEALLKRDEVLFLDQKVWVQGLASCRKSISDPMAEWNVPICGQFESIELGDKVREAMVKSAADNCLPPATVPGVYGTRSEDVGSAGDEEKEESAGKAPLSKRTPPPSSMGEDIGGISKVPGLSRAALLGIPAAPKKREKKKQKPKLKGAQDLGATPLDSFLAPTSAVSEDRKPNTEKKKSSKKKKKAVPAIVSLMGTVGKKTKKKKKKTKAAADALFRVF